VILKKKRMINNFNEAAIFIALTVLFSGYIYYRLKYPNESKTTENIEYNSEVNPER
jgi:hypothetical protein